MFYIRNGFPEESEIVICTVTKILPNAVFAVLDEYNGKSGMIHISEIAPGRIRTINEYVNEGKKIICKVLAVRSDKGHIDLSLRRVTEGQRREKLNQIKKEQKAEKIIELLAKEMKKDPKQFYQEITQNVFSNYVYLHEFFEGIVNSEVDIKTIKLNSKIESPLLELIKQKMVPPEVTIEGTLTLSTYDGNGIELLKETFSKMKDDSISYKYLGGGKYKLVIKGQDYEIIEQKYKNKVEKSISFFQKKGGDANFVRA